MPPAQRLRVVVQQRRRKLLSAKETWQGMRCADFSVVREEFKKLGIGAVNCKATRGRNNQAGRPAVVMRSFYGGLSGRASMSRGRSCKAYGVAVRLRVCQASMSWTSRPPSRFGFHV